MLVKFTLISRPKVEHVLVNPDHIVSVHPTEDGSVITTTVKEGAEIEVEENINEVLCAVNTAPSIK